eukprot:1160200-Pelagomonas_calceolata.AAC.2
MVRHLQQLRSCNKRVLRSAAVRRDEFCGALRAEVKKGCQHVMHATHGCSHAAKITAMSQGPDQAALECNGSRPWSIQGLTSAARGCVRTHRT